MNRTDFALAGTFGASTLLLVDSAIKGTALLALAAIVAMLLRRDSAATRHLVWLLALVALLIVPVLSATLPEWRVLPRWAGVSPQPLAADTSDVPVVGPTARVVDRPQVAVHVEPMPPSFPFSPVEPVDQPSLARPAASPVLAASEIRSELSVESRSGFDALPLVWVIGFCSLLLRLLAARVLLWTTERRGTAIWSSMQPAKATRDPLVTALESVYSQLGIERHVTLLIHPDKTIPVVWGIFRCRLLLPAAARHWSGEHLRSVLLHELAHVKRRDTLSQLLAQLSCALHWFNPLVWFAAWRMGVERERACDDLVLASGVRPSAYAEHLLDAVTGLSPARWTQSCGLAMARKSSLEGRLVAVLSQNRNRRGVPVSLAMLGLIIAVGIAVPLAMLRAGEDPPGQIPIAADTRTESGGQPQAVPNTPNLGESPTPTDGSKLPPHIEGKLQWGEPTNGLRAALVRPQALGEAGAGEVFDFRFVVQNVSEQLIRLGTASVAPTRRYLIVRSGGVPLSAFRDGEPTRSDHLLQPREVAILRLFSHVTEGESITGSDPKMTFSAEFNIEHAPAGSWTGKLVAAELHAATAGYGLMPDDKSAKELFKSWNAGTRRNEKIPGGLIGLLAESVQQFTEYNPTWKTTPRLLEMLETRFDATRDWTGPEAIALLDELAEVQDSPINMALFKEADRTIHTGTPLPPELADAPWSRVHPSGLRLAWLLEPRESEHPLNTPLKSRILIYNVRNGDVVFRTDNFHQVGHTAIDANGAEVKTESTYWTTLPRFLPYRLGQGEYVELYAPGIAVGANKDYEDWRNVRVGTWIDAQAGDEVTVRTNPIPFYDRNEQPPSEHESGWWRDLIRTRLARYEPLPDAAEERKLLLYRVAMELFGTPVSAEINDSFVNDRGPDALDSLAKRLHDRTGTTPFTGSLVSGPTTFRVLPTDPDAANRPRIIHNPGRYALGGKIVLSVTRRPAGERIVNEASIRFYSDDPAKPAPAEPYEIKLPNGYDTWVAAWMRGGGVLWIRDKSGIRAVDFSNPAKVQEKSLEAPQDLERIPPPILDTFHAASDRLDVAPRTQSPPAATPNSSNRNP
jgi:beta-lactamase regulating signal transducer with metallopeptidase domain